MNIVQNTADDIIVLEFEGHLDTNTTPDAEAEISKFVQDGATKILVNFEKLEYISSAGLRILLATAKQLKGQGGELRICSLNEVVEEVFDISGFSTIFNVFKSQPDALSGF